jgi:hypothetical protein
MGCAASTAPNTADRRVADPVVGSNHPGSPQLSPSSVPGPDFASSGSIGRRKSSRFAANTDLSEEEKAQLERIAKNRPPQNTLSSEENSLARYEVVTFGIKDDGYYNSNVTVIERSKSFSGSSMSVDGSQDPAENSGSLRRKGSIMRKPSVAVEDPPPQAVEERPPAALADSKADSGEAPPALTRSASRKKVIFSGR